MSVEISNLPELVAQLTTSDFTPVVHNGTTYKHKTASYFVRKSEDETITGVKTFSSSPIVPDGDAIGEAVNYGQLSSLSSTVSTLDSENVKLTGVQTISDVKTFSSSPIVPTPTIGTQAANKTYVDATISSLGSVVEISADYTVAVGVSEIVVTTANAINITIPAGLDLHWGLAINRNVASANSITVTRSGSELIEGATSFVVHGAKASATNDFAICRLKKVDSTNWRFVEGVISGSGPTGNYKMFPNGDIDQSGSVTVQSPIWTNAGLGIWQFYYLSNAPLITFPMQFKVLRSMAGSYANGVFVPQNSNTSSFSGDVYSFSQPASISFSWNGAGNWRSL